MVWHKGSVLGHVALEQSSRSSAEAGLGLRSQCRWGREPTPQDSGQLGRQRAAPAGAQSSPETRELTLSFWYHEEHCLFHYFMFMLMEDVDFSMLILYPRFLNIFIICNKFIGILEFSGTLAGTFVSRDNFTISSLKMQS